MVKGPLTSRTDGWHELFRLRYGHGGNRFCPGLEISFSLARPIKSVITFIFIEPLFKKSRELWQ
jgi:hypothetical protein